MGMEGIVSKRIDDPYRSGRGRSWLKIKCSKSQEFVIGGFTDPAGARVGFGALLLGFYDDSGALRYAGRVGTGFDIRGLRDLSTRLKKLARKSMPFAGAKERRLQGRSLGRTVARLRNCFCRLDLRWAAAPPRIQGVARRQAGS